MVPLFFNRRFDSQFSFTLPDFHGLWIIIGLVIVLNVLILLSFVSIKKKTFDYDTCDLLVSGRATIAFFLAIFEELCALIGSGSLQGNGASRFEFEAQHGVFAAANLFESYPQRNLRPVNQVVYFLILLIPVCLIWGFHILIHFQTSLPAVDYQTFFSRYFPAMLVEIIFACFLLFAASYCGKLADRIFQISRFESYLLVCRCVPIIPAEQPTNHPIENINPQPQGKWSEVTGPEKNLVGWLKSPETLTKFSAHVMWARITTESSAPSGIRNVTSFCQDQNLTGFVDTILNALKSVNFETMETSKTAPRLQDN
ncbi:MAG: hypothetical protein ACP5U1_03945 [Desulfomonilaceae bacterium]